MSLASNFGSLHIVHAKIADEILQNSTILGLKLIGQDFHKFGDSVDCRFRFNEVRTERASDEVGTQPELHPRDLRKRLDGVREQVVNAYGLLFTFRHSSFNDVRKTRKGAEIARTGVGKLRVLLNDYGS